VDDRSDAVINQGLKEMLATDTWQNNERKIAAAELRRLARATRRADGSSDRTALARLPRLPEIGSVAGAWRSLGRGLVAIVGRRAPA
jgi:hypothetical protein